jgi:AraC-like DNA-binding protein/quercetin dioxygenase-like cupin family protein
MRDRYGDFAMLLETAEVLWTARYDYDPGWVLKVHSHEFFQAVYLVAGAGTLTLDGTQYPLEPCHVFVASPGVTHGLKASTRVRTLDMKFNVRNRALASALRAIMPLYCAADSSIRRLFERIWQEGDGQQPLYREMCALYLLEFLLRLQRISPPRKAATPVSRTETEVARADMLTGTVMSFVSEHIAEPLTVRRLADELGCSERSLRQHLHNLLGVSPMEYVTHFRIDRAKSLIRESDCALKEVASMVGFRSIHHFTRVFHRVTGMSPGAWRERYARGVRKDININPGFRNENWTVQRGA